MTMAPPSCPVCRALPVRAFMVVQGRDYWRCDVCLATFLDPGQRLSADDERAHYRHHRNDPDDAGYRGFLSRLAGPLLARLGHGLSGLDYGCGPFMNSGERQVGETALVRTMREAGHAMTGYDPFFRADPDALERQYDFITCTEVIEHFHRPADEFDRMDRLLRPGGWLGLMTCFQTDDARFGTWHYRRDPTHVVFYRAETLNVIAASLGWACEIPGKDVVLMRKCGQMTECSEAGARGARLGQAGPGQGSFDNRQDKRGA